jgi:hypothetical protein
MIKGKEDGAHMKDEMRMLEALRYLYLVMKLGSDMQADAHGGRRCCR